MGLTLAEEKELIELEKEEAQLSPSPPQRAPSQNQITPAELAELEQLEAEEAEISNPGLLQQGAELLGQAGSAVESVTGAPARSAIEALQVGEGIPGALSAFGKQFAEDPALAPTGQQIVERAGLPTPEEQAAFEQDIGAPAGSTKIDPLASQPLLSIGAKALGLDPSLSVSEAAGLGIEAAADPTNILPFGLVVKGAKKGIKGIGGATQAILKGSAKATGADKTINIVSKSTRATKRAVTDLINPRVAPDAGAFLNVAKNNGIDPAILPESVQFGKESFTSRFGRGVAEGPLGQERLERHNEAVNQIGKAIESKITDLSGGENLSKDLAGLHIRDSYNRGVTSFFDQMDETYTAAQDLAPDMVLSQGSIDKISKKLGGIETFAKGRLKRGVSATQKSQARELLNAVDAIRSGDGTFKQATEALRDVGEVAFGGKPAIGQLPSDTKRLRDIYGALREEIVTTTRDNLGDQFADSLVENNKAMTNFFGKNSALAGIIGNPDLADEKVFQRIILSGDTRKIDALKSVISQDDFNRLKGAYLDNVTKRNIEGDVNFRSVFNSLRNKAEVTGSILTESELKDFRDLLDLGDRVGSPILSSSGTGASTAFQSLTQTIRSTIENEAILEALKARAASNALTPKDVKVIKGALRKRDLKPGVRATLKALQVTGSQRARRRDERK